MSSRNDGNVLLIVPLDAGYDGNIWTITLRDEDRDLIPTLGVTWTLAEALEPE